VSVVGVRNCVCVVSVGNFVCESVVIVRNCVIVVSVGNFV
jgi:hypothetical protein